jgi:hypothetical protein
MATNIDHNIIDRFAGDLKAILELELKAGNKIVETYESKDSAFPMPNATMIFLQKPFMTPIQNNSNGIEFNEVNDPHYWKSEYFDKQYKQFLCCKFD